MATQTILVINTTQLEGVAVVKCAACKAWVEVADVAAHAAWEAQLVVKPLPPTPPKT